MGYDRPTYTEEDVAHFEAHAARWEKVALDSDPDTAFHCRDYAAHLRTLAECVRMDMLERDARRYGPVGLTHYKTPVRRVSNGDQVKRLTTLASARQVRRLHGLFAAACPGTLVPSRDTFSSE
jgi:hypothetical protein